MICLCRVAIDIDSARLLYEIVHRDEGQKYVADATAWPCTGDRSAVGEELGGVDERGRR
jgi:hypothetical protein